MERSEPTLVPEWLRSNGSVAWGGNSAHHFATSSSHSDVSPRSTRNRFSKNTNDYESPRSAFFFFFLDRTSSSNSRRNSINNGFKHDKESNARAYSSFSRSHHDKDSDREKARLLIGVKKKSLIRLYVKFGHFWDAYDVFEKMPMRDEDLFKCLVSGFGSNGFYN